MAVALALIASLCWGVADFMGGSLSRRHPLLVVVQVSQAVGLAAALAHVRLHERLSSGQRAGVGLALAGVLAIAGR